MKASDSHSDLSKSVLKTLLYFDIFKYPLTADEVFFHLQSNHVTTQDVAQELEKLNRENTVHSLDRFYSVQNDNALESRRKKGNQMAEQGLKIAFRKARLISRFPFVRAVLASGSLSKGYMDEHSDLDFFVVTAPDRLWISRMLLVLYKRIFLFNSHKHFCINYYVDDEHLEIEEKNLFTATELVTLLPLYGNDYCHRLFAANAWTREFLPNAKLRSSPGIGRAESSFIKRTAEKVIDLWGGSFFNKFFMRLTLTRWQKLYQQSFSKSDFEVAFKTRPHTSKNHVNHYQKKIMELYRQKLGEYQSRLGISLL